MMSRSTYLSSTYDLCYHLTLLFNINIKIKIPILNSVGLIKPEIVDFKVIQMISIYVNKRAFVVFLS